jgi:hypothetical protein
MQDMQEVFDKIQELKLARKEIGREYRNALAQTDRYGELKEEIKTLRDKKKSMESAVQAEMGSRFEQFEKANREIESSQQLLTDIAMTNLMEGKSISLKDKNNAEYEPSYKITFKKIN